MTGTEANNIQAIIENEGFHYAFVHYSNFEKIEDPVFHERRKAFVDASKALADYVGCDE